MKKCKNCNEIKPIDEFYTHKKMADGHLSKCKDCVKARIRKHRANNDHVRDYDRQRYHTHPGRRERTAKTAKAWNEKNPQGYRAHYTVSNAVRDGKLERKPCEVCGEENVHAHHDDYEKPLHVRWLCVRHHALLHASEKMK